MSDRVELFLYHALANTGTIEFSTVSAAGPWTAVTLSAPKCVVDALADWQAQVNAAIRKHFMPESLSVFVAGDFK